MGKKYYKELYSKIFFLLIITAIIIIGFLIVKPFIAALLSGGVIAYLFHPLYEGFGRRIKNENLRAFLIALLLVLIVTIPAVIMLSVIAREAYQTYTSIEQHRLGSNFMEFICSNGENILCKGVMSILSFLPESDLNFYMRSIIEVVTSSIVQSISKFLAAVPNIILNVVIVLLVVFYLLKDGKNFIDKFSNLLPFDNKQKNRIFKRFHQITYGVFIGNLAVVGVQGLVGAIGFLLLGLSSPLLWGFMIALFALIPYFGTAIIWLPAALNLIIIGNLTSNNLLVVKGIILIGYGIFVISTIDNILKLKIIGDKADIHPLLVLLGVLGGLNLFGIMGIVIGPILLSLLLVLVDIYQEEVTQST